MLVDPEKTGTLGVRILDARAYPDKERAWYRILVTGRIEGAKFPDIILEVINVHDGGVYLAVGVPGRGQIVDRIQGRLQPRRFKDCIRAGLFDENPLVGARSLDLQVSDLEL